MRFLFTTIQFVESDFYARVSEHLRDDHGHEVFHVAISRRSAAEMRRRGLEVRCLPDEMEALGDVDVAAEVARIEATYDIPSLRDVYLADSACSGRPEAWCLERAVRTFCVLEQAFEAVRPDVLVPEVGSETMRSVAQLVAEQRGVDFMMLFYTIFPRPLRLFVNTAHAPIVDQAELRELDDAERREVEAFIARYTERRKPTLAHRRSRVTPRTLRDFFRHIRVAATEERDNEYLRPQRFVKNYAVQNVRRRLTRPLYEPVDNGDRPFVYFPLHVTDDFKVKKIIPHCVDQSYLIKQVAMSLPQGYDVVLKEHPVSLGRNPVSMLRDLASVPNVRLVDPYTNSHELIQRAEAVVVISSTVGLEALLYGRPVLTMGKPFYSGFGVTLDIESFADIRRAVPEVLRFRPDRERILRFLHASMRSTYDGAPAGVSATDENARTLAASLDAAARERAGAAALATG